MELYRWEFEVTGNIRVLDFEGLLDFHACDHLCSVWAWGDGASTAESLKLMKESYLEDGFLNGVTGLIELDLEFHDITTCGCTYEACSDIFIIFV